MIAAAAERLGSLKSWQRVGVAFLAGAVTILAFPPFSMVLVLWLAFPALIWLLDGCRTQRAAALTGWAFGFGHFIPSFYWITSAFYVDRDKFGVFAIPAVGALCAAFALYIALTCATTHRIAPPGEDDMPDDRTVTMTLRILVFAAAWTVLEWTRSWLLSGLPWNPVGVVWSETMTPIGLPVAQAAAVIGTYGLSFLTILAAAAPALLAHTPRLRRAWLTVAIPTVVLLVVGGLGALRLASADTRFVSGVKFRLVQANIPQTDRARPSLWESQLHDYVRLSTEDRPSDVTHVVWGEAAVPPTFFLNRDEAHRRIAASAAPESGLLITGADRGMRDPDGYLEIYNSLYVLTSDARIVGAYDKTHLVPFGEYMPLRWLIPFDKITGGTGDFTPGAGLVTLRVPSLPPFTPLICYEITFSGDVTPRSDSERPQWLLSLTNDAWFGMSTGPHQHFAMARLRAVEEGLPVVRTANTGISAVVDSYGRTVAHLGLGQRGVLDVPLPTPVVHSTPFGHLGNFIPLLLATFGGGGAFLFRLRAGRSPG